MQAAVAGAYTRTPGVLARSLSSSELDAAERGAAAIAVAEVETRVDDDGREWIVRRLPDGVPDRSLTIERSSVSPRTPSASRIA